MIVLLAILAGRHATAFVPIEPAPSVALLSLVPGDVSAVAGTDNAMSLLTELRAMPLLGVARRFGVLRDTELAWKKLDDKLALRGHADALLLQGPVAVGIGQDGAGFVIIAGISAEAATLLRSKLEAVPTALVEGRPIFSVERGGLRMAILDTPQAKGGVRISAPHICLLAPPDAIGSEMLRKSVRLAAGVDEQQSAWRGGWLGDGLAALAQSGAWYIARAKSQRAEDANTALSCRMTASGGTLKLRVTIGDALRSPPATPSRPPIEGWSERASKALRNRPGELSVVDDRTALIFEALDPGRLAKLPGFLARIEQVLPGKSKDPVMLAIARLGTSPVAGDLNPEVTSAARFALTAFWPVIEDPDAPASTSGVPKVTLPGQLALADRTMDGLIAQAGSQAPMTFAPLALPPTASRSTSLTLSKGSIEEVLLGPRLQADWQAVGAVGVVARLAMLPPTPTGTSDAETPTSPSGPRLPPPSWMYSPTPTLADATSEYSVVLARGLVLPRVLAPLVERPGQRGVADLLRTIEDFRFTIQEGTGRSIVLSAELKTADAARGEQPAPDRPAESPR